MSMYSPRSVGSVSHKRREGAEERGGDRLRRSKFMVPGMPTSPVSAQDGSSIHSTESSAFLLGSPALTALAAVVGGE